MKKENFLLAACILALLLSAVAGILFVNLGRANPYSEHKWVSPPADTKPPKISMLSPKNVTYNVNNVFLTFNVSIGESKDTNMLTEVYYKVDWQKNNTSVYHLDMVNDPYHYEHWITEFSYNLNLTGIPEGNHSIVVTADAHGSYAIWPTAYYFDIGGSSSVNFTIDTTLDITAPNISVLSLENKNFNTTDVPLDFTVNESVSQITYSLDRQENVTIAGNTTLTGLSDGEHSLTVYAEDNAGNMGASETSYFSVEVPESSSITLVAAASVASAAVVGVCLLVYFKKRNH